MSGITIDYQDVTQLCEHCNKMFDVSRGSVYDDGISFSIYIAAMHKCKPGELVLLAIAIQKGYEGAAKTCSVTLDVWPTESEFQTSVIDPRLSPWLNESYLGQILNRDEAISLPQINTIFHIADHIAIQNPTINSYLCKTFLSE